MTERHGKQQVAGATFITQPSAVTAFELNQPGCVGLDAAGRLVVDLADGATVDVAQSTASLGELVVTAGSGDRLLLLMGFVTRDDGEPPPTAAEIDVAVDAYRRNLNAKGK
ncbi:hypothetical protein [Roseomonas indoligenes]|uniref:Uncharacterized protein n=1 Tax=Roseomonas indoligenes TaxID=2820811 RepID=A0A940S6R3_9PROT|nr:hypothetical protein [Pararoseomonas indoligenes]MBP0495806.1 hypothetical protein [Pararoseomonas indoligenes]